ncbi:MAG: hypothetical protein EBT13_13045 [Rhodobacteraceae bacterium]|jgi:heme-degrading monooxygenase HmoA|nr:hypothetical protein [Paracoccaceae bacterium]
MSYVSHLSVKVLPGQREKALSAFKSRRVFEECAAAVSGFIEGRVLVSADCPDTFCVAAEWAAMQDYQDWLDHPVRATQSDDLSKWAAEAPEIRFFHRMD